MAEERRHEITPALNRELTVLGVPRVLLFCAVVIALVVLILTWSFTLALFTLISVAILSLWATASDPAFPQIVWSAIKNRSLYDPFRPQDWNLNLCGFLDDGEAFFTRTADVGIVLEARGVDTDCLSTEERDRIASRFEQAARALDDRMILQQIYFRRRKEVPKPSPVGHGISDTLAESRARHLDELGLYEECLYYLLLALDPRSQLTLGKAVRSQQLRLYFSKWNYKRQVLADIEDLREKLSQKTRDFTMQLRDITELRTLGYAEAFPVLWRLLNFSGEAPADFSPDDELDSRLADSFIACDQRHLEVDDSHVIVQALKSPPAESRPLMFADLQKIQGNFQIVTTWQQLSAERHAREVARKKKHFWRGRHRGIPGAAKPGVERLTDGTKLQAVDDLENIERSLAKRDFPGLFSLTSVVYDRDPKKARATEAEVRSVFTRAGATLLVDRYNQPNALFSTVPGGYDRLFRRILLMNSHNADLALWAKADTGESRNSHLDRECLGTLRTEQATGFSFNLHGSLKDGRPDVAHTTISGSTGSGKSVFGAWLASELQKYRPLTLICDRGGSYQGVVEAYGGASVTVAPGRQAFTVNPFAEPLTPAHRKFLLLFVRTLIETSGEKMTGIQLEELDTEITRLYALDSTLHTLGNLRSGLSKGLARPLSRWVQGGADGEWFDNPADSVTFNRLQYFDFPKELDNNVARAFLLYVLHRWRKSVIAPENASVLKASFIDEAAELFKDSGELAEYAVEAAVTFRKHNGFIVLLTQSIGAFLDSPALLPLVQNVETQIFFSDRRVNGDLTKTLQLSPEETEMIRQLRSRDEILFKQGSTTKRLSTCLDPAALWLCGTDSKQKAIRTKAFQAHGPVRALEELR